MGGNLLEAHGYFIRADVAALAYLVGHAGGVYVACEVAVFAAVTHGIKGAAIAVDGDFIGAAALPC